MGCNKKIEMYPTDILYVEGKPTEDKVKDMIMTRMIKRDELMAAYIIEKFNSMKKINPKQKALVIMNYRHAYKKEVPRSADNVGIYLDREYPGRVVNILINNYNAFKKMPLRRVCFLSAARRVQAGYRLTGIYERWLLRRGSRGIRYV